jgi:hypothetical protein
VEAFFQLRYDARLADSGFAGDKHDLAVAGLGARPTAQQQVDLLVAANQRRERRSVQGLEPVGDRIRTQYLPRWHRRGDVLDLDRAEVAVLEEIADEPARSRGDDNGTGLGQRLQPGGEVRSLAHNRLLLNRAFADQITDDHQPGGDPDTRLELDGFDIEATDRVDHAQPCPDRPLGVVLMRLRVAEIHQHTVAHVPGDKAVGPSDYFGDSAVIHGDDLTQILGVESRRECSRADQVAEHHGQLAPFGGCGINQFPALCRWFRPAVIAQRGNRSEQFAAMSDQADADVREILGGQLRQHRSIDRVVAKRLFVLLQPETVEPRRYIHARLPHAVIAALV